MAKKWSDLTDAEKQARYAYARRRRAEIAGNFMEQERRRAVRARNLGRNLGREASADIYSVFTSAPAKRGPRGPMTEAQKAARNAAARARRADRAGLFMEQERRRAVRGRNARANFGMAPLANPYSIFTDVAVKKPSKPMTEAAKQRLKAYKAAKKAAKAGTYTENQLRAHAEGAARLRAWAEAKARAPPPLPKKVRERSRISEVESLIMSAPRKRGRRGD